MSVQAVLMSGDLYVQPLNDDYTGATAGLIPMGFADKLEIKVASDLKEMTSKGRDDYAQIIASVALAKPAELSLEMSQLSNDNFAAALMGTLTTNVQTATHTIDESRVCTTQNVAYPLAHGNISNVSVKVGSTPAVLTTDYTIVDAVTGTIKATSGSTVITAGATALVTYDWKVTKTATVDNPVGTAISTGHSNITGVVVTAGTLGAETSKTLTTDYTVNARLGTVTPVVGGAIVAGNNIIITYGYTANTKDLINGATRSQVKWNIMLDGKSLVDGRNMLLKIPRSLLTPNGSIDFMAGGFMSLKMSGRMLTPPGSAAPFTLDMDQ